MVAALMAVQRQLERVQAEEVLQRGQFKGTQATMELVDKQLQVPELEARVPLA